MTVLLAAIVAYLILAISKQNRIIQKEQYQNSLLANSRFLAEETLKARNELYSIRHDLKHFIKALNDEDRTEKSEKIQNIMQSYEEIANELIVPIESPSQIINLVLNEKRTEAYEKEIDVKCLLQFNTPPAIRDDDLFLVLSNMLDNAIQHIGKEKKVYVEITQEDLYFSIIVRNSADKKTPDNKPIHKEMTDAHGFGIDTITRIIASYPNCLCDFQQEDSFFIATVLFYNPQ